jgi:hypothetical protein
VFYVAGRYDNRKISTLKVYQSFINLLLIFLNKIKRQEKRKKTNEMLIFQDKEYDKRTNTMLKLMNSFCTVYGMKRKCYKCT